MHTRGEGLELHLGLAWTSMGFLENHGFTLYNRVIVDCLCLFLMDLCGFYWPVFFHICQKPKSFCNFPRKSSNIDMSNRRSRPSKGRAVYDSPKSSLPRPSDHCLPFTTHHISPSLITWQRMQCHVSLLIKGHISEPEKKRGRKRREINCAGCRRGRSRHRSCSSGSPGSAHASDSYL